MKRGITRWVFLTEKYAIKIPVLSSWKQFLLGLLANMQEKYWWKNMPHKNLARVCYCDRFGFLLIMERADYAMCNNPNEQAQKEISKFFQECTEIGLPVDPKPSNIGIFDGQYKLIDYGS